jgi:succinyl-CoA synthetase beta subunit
MIRQLRTFPLLDGYRGRPKADVPALVDAIVKLSELACANADRIEALEVNPLLVRSTGQGVVALDCVLTTRAERAMPAR